MMHIGYGPEKVPNVINVILISAELFSLYRDVHHLLGTKCTWLHVHFKQVENHTQELYFAHLNGILSFEFFKASLLVFAFYKTY